MGRDVTGLHMDNKPSVVKATGTLIHNGNPGVSEGTDDKKLSTPASKSTGAENTQEDLTSPKTAAYVSEGTDDNKLSTPASKSTGAENTQEDLTSPNSEGTDDNTLSTSTPKSTGAENTQEHLFSPKSTGAENTQEHLFSPKTGANGTENVDSEHLFSPKTGANGTENVDSEHLTSPKTGANGMKNVDSEHRTSPKTAANGTENVDPTPFHTKDSESNSPKSPLMPRKHPNEEDNWSAASSTAGSGRTARSKVTIGTAPTFRIVERAEKRREFNQKLEEKQQALEAERIQAEARAKEEQEAAIKQLRKNLIVKAKPVPSFYYEAPPPKPEPKKLPLTRPKSPKLTRRKSYGDLGHASQDEKAKSCSRTHRSSLGTHRKQSGPANEVKNKGQASEESGNGGGKL